MDRENIQLTEGFFQELFEANDVIARQPILQILRSRVVESGTISMRLHCSDGLFGYTNCAMHFDLVDKLRSDGLYASLTSGTFPIIRIIRYQFNTGS